MEKEEKSYCEINKELISLRNKEYYQKNKEKIKSKTKEYRENNSEKYKEYMKNYYENNKEKRNNESKKWYEENKEKYLEYQKKYSEENKDKIKDYKKNYYTNNKEQISKKTKEYYTENKENIMEWQKNFNNNKKKSNPLYKLSCIIRTSIYCSIKRYGYTKKSKTRQIIGCDFVELKKHLESKFEPWMNWENHGKYNGGFNFGWDIDHIIPLSSAKNEEEVIKLNHYTNLKPLCSKINRDIKKDKILN